MTVAPTLPLAEITTKAMRLLIQELGVVNTARFLSQFPLGFGDSVDEKDRQVGSMTVAEIVAAINQSKQRHGNSMH